MYTITSLVTLKTSSNELFELISSLSPKEISRYKKLCREELRGNEPDYFRLFLSYLKLKNPNEEKIRKQLRITNFKRIKNYLHHHLLNFLATQETLNDEKEIMNLIQVSDLLMERQLLKQARNALEKARKKAVRKELFYYVLIVDERLYNVSSNMGDTAYEEYVFHHYTEREFLPLINKIIVEEDLRISMLKRRMFNDRFSGLVRDEHSFKALNDYLWPVISKGEDYPQSFRSLNDYYIITAYYFQQLGDANKAVYYFEKSAEYTEENNPHPRGNVPYATVAKHNLLFAYSRNRLQYKMRPILDKLYSTKHTHKTLRTMVMRTYCTYEADYCRHFPEYPLRERKLREIEGQFEKHFSKTNTLQFMHACMNLSTAYFCDSNFKKALSFITQMESREGFYEQRQMVGIIKLYKLIVFLEMGKHDLLAFSFRNTYRYLLKNSNYKAFEKIVMSTLRKMTEADSVRKQKILLEAAYNELIPIKNDPNERMVFHLFEFTGWIKCKLEGKDFRNLMSEG